MRKVLLVIASMLLLSSATVAKPEYTTIPSNNGTYNVSFDLGNSVNYQKHVEDPESTESYTGVKFTCNKIRLDLIHDNGIYIMLCEHEVPIDANPEANKQFIAEFFQEIGIYNPLLYDRVIDGLPGAIGIGSKGASTVYFTQYWPIGLCFQPDKCMGMTSCEIRSLCIVKNLKIHTYLLRIAIILSRLVQRAFTTKTQRHKDELTTISGQGSICAPFVSLCLCG